jgi:ribulose-bisphosphate carboxylase large chain
MPSISPTPGGGMSMEKIPQMLEVYGSDVMLLIGGDLIGRSPCLKTNAQDFLKVMGR